MEQRQLSPVAEGHGIGGKLRAQRVRLASISIAMVAVVTAILAPSASAAAPTVTTAGATFVGANRAILHATVNPGGSATTINFEYGTSSETFIASTTKLEAGSGSVPIEMAQSLSGLSSQTKYFLRAVASNKDGTALGNEVTLTTTSLGAPVFESAFGSFGSGEGQFQFPSYMDMDGKGNFYVADTLNYRIQKFDSKGKYLSQFGSKGSGDGQFGYPTGIAVDSKENVFVVDSGFPTRVEKFNSEGKYVSKFGSAGTGEGQFEEPQGIAIDSKDNIYVSDIDLSRVQKFNSEGKYLELVGKTKAFKEPIGLAFDPQDNLYVVNEGTSSVFKFDSFGSYQKEIGSSGPGKLSSPVTAVTADPKGFIYVGSNGQVKKFTTEGEYLSSFGGLGVGAGESAAGGIIVDSGGDLWVSDAGAHIMRWVYTPLATTEAATNIKGTEATLQGTVNPKGNVSLYEFEYGTTTSYGNITTFGSAGGGSVGVSVSKTISGLTPSTTYHYRVVATSAVGTAYGADMTFKTATPPKNVAPPIISPSTTPAEGVPVSTGNGVWSGSPTPTFTYQWRRCNAAGAECVNIAGATKSSYTPVKADVEYTLVSAVTGTNVAGSVTAYSTATGKVKPLGQITEFALPEGGEPWAITSGPDGKLWYTGGAIFGLAKMTTSGSVTEYPVTGSSPNALTSGPGSKLWFAGIYDKVGSMTTTGTVAEYKAGGSTVQDVAKGADGKVWFTRSGSAVGSVTSTGVVTEYALPEAGSPSRITPGPDGNLWFTDISCGTKSHCKIGKVTTSGVITEYSLPLERIPADIVTGPDGNLWFTISNNRIGKITTSGEITEYTLSGESPSPVGIAAGPDGKLWFTQIYAGKIASITTTGTVASYALPAGSAPWDITQGPDGMMWFTNSGTNKIGTIVP